MVGYMIKGLYTIIVFYI